MQETGRWPLLLRLVNKILADQGKLQPDITAPAEELLSRLRLGGKLQVDQITGAASQQLDISDPDQRRKAVRTTIQASTSLLSPGEHDRFAELAVFAEDETIPVTLITELWQATGGMDGITSRALCARLADLALLTLIPGSDGGAVVVHDVIREFLRQELGDTWLETLNGILLDTVARGLPKATTPEPDGQESNTTTWWTLPGSARYLWEHLIEHMLAAGRRDPAIALAADLRWVGARLQQSGTAGPYADLAIVGTPQAERLGRAFGQAAHLLAPTEPEHSLIDILYSRVSHQPEWGAQALELTGAQKLPALINRWTLPDLPHQALLRTLTGHGGAVTSVAVAPDGTWLATASTDQTARIWNPATGLQRAMLAGHTGPVNAVAIAPDGTWLATASYDKTARIWDSATGLQRAMLAGHAAPVTTVVIAPDGTWLATAGLDRTVRIWDKATLRQRVLRTDHTTFIRAIAAAPDGTWLATGSGGWTIQAYDIATGKQDVVLADNRNGVSAIAIADDGTWLASGSEDKAVQIWDLATRRRRTTLTERSGHVTAIAIAPQGTWLATASTDQTARIWDPVTGEQRAVLIGHTETVTSVAIAPDSTWLATASTDRTVRIWDVASGQIETALGERIHPTRAVMFAPDGTWVASIGEDETVRIWDVLTGEQRAVLISRQRGPVTAVAIAPHGSALASASEDGTVRIWDTVTGELRDTRTGLGRSVAAMAISSDGELLAAGPGRVAAIASDGSWFCIADGATVKVRDVGSGTERNTLAGHAQDVTAVAIAPDSTWLVSGSDDKTVRIWDLSTGTQRVVLVGHSGPVTGVAIAPGGSWLATVSSDRTIRIWDQVTGVIRAFMRVDKPLKACAWSPSGQMLAVAGDAGLYLFTFNS